MEEDDDDDDDDDKEDDSNSLLGETTKLFLPPLRWWRSLPPNPRERRTLCMIVWSSEGYLW